MSDAGLSDAYPRASPWPPLVALALVTSEIGVVFGLRPVTIGGLLLFIGSVAGILTESQHVTRPLRVIAVLSTLAAVGGLLLLRYEASFRGVSLLIAGGIGITTGIVGRQLVRWRGVA
ncbi:uncharacterized protein HHUB_6073 (plasmid) [Halobacterium hubeiense]|uniref:Cox cluster protein n=1 Tax=Halobacterium hubeiense TaxID=1407499 RepID=A0A0U5HAX4_9EURY|nr:hypothetical protein [Halobacterium hubeiense]CQH65173.1 uncharacterized protein HHUB_6073 [Halobacterium hubeiense]